MKTKILYWFLAFNALIGCAAHAQNISLYDQFNGRYDFTFVGNTLNTIENNSNPGEPSPPCTILTSSSATLALDPNDVIESAYLYWAGSGTGDFDVKLNGTDITAERTFAVTNSTGRPCFGAFANITTQVQNTGNGIYTFSDLDLTSIIAPYCPNGGNFGGWTMVIVYGNPALPLNQLNIYDGMQSVPDSISITLNSLNVIDNQNAKIGFVAWEGDKNIAEGETLTINGSVLQSLPLNPAENAFNGTNSFTNSDQLFNMDLDVYNIQNNIHIGDTSALIQLTSGRDFVMINCIVTKLNSQLPDATISADAVSVACNSHTITVDFTVYNVNATADLQANVPIAIYADTILVAQTQTDAVIPVGGSESHTITLTVPDTVIDAFTLSFIIDDNGNGNGIVIESDEGNNKEEISATLISSDPLPVLAPLVSCNLGLTRGVFNFGDYEEAVKVNATDTVSFYASETDMQQQVNPISTMADYHAVTTPATIFVRVDNGTCYNTASFLLITRKCPPTVFNYVSANTDQFNDSFHIDGLRNIFMNYQLSVFNRWGQLVWTGNNNTPEWDGFANRGLRINGNHVPDGTYFYVLELNDPEYPEPLQGFLYLTKN